MHVLPHAELLQLLHYDPETGCFFWRINGKKRGIWQRAGGLKPHGYEVIGVGYHRYYSHRLAIYYTTGQWPSGQVDHINGNRSDNRLSNLRVATHQENQRNRCLQRNNTSGTPGVHWSTGQKRWISRIKIDGRMRQLGTFIDKDEAIRARKEAEKEIFGSFTRKGEAA